MYNPQAIDFVSSTTCNSIKGTTADYPAVQLVLYANLPAAQGGSLLIPNEKAAG
jgi:hypothetical protein